LENYEKNKKDKTRYTKNPDFESGSRLRVGKVLAPHNTRPKTLRIKCAKGCSFSKYLFFLKIIKN